MEKYPCAGYVVVVDDEEDTRELIRELLELRGYQVATAENGLDAIAVMDDVPSICLVILDLMMPLMDGFELLKHMATDPRRKDLNVWVSTSAPESAPSGVPCLPKPVDVGRLLSIVGQHCVAAQA